MKKLIIAAILMVATTTYAFTCPSYGTRQPTWNKLHTQTYNGIAYPYRDNYVQITSATPLPVMAFQPGTVALITTTDSSTEGVLVVIKHDQFNTSRPFYTSSWHLSGVTLTVGDRVAEGDIIGYATDLLFTLSYQPSTSLRWYLSQPSIYCSPLIILAQTCK